MRTLDIRRHAEAAKPDTALGALSQEGHAAAMHLASSAPRYSLVVVSPRPRTQDTARAIMGRFDEIEPGLDVASDDVITVDEYFSLLTPEAVVAFIRMRRPTRAFVAAQLELWANVASRLPEGRTALIVAHGANVELPAVDLAVTLVTEPRKVPVGYLEGVRVTYEGGVPRVVSSLNMA